MLEIFTQFCCYVLLTLVSPSTGQPVVHEEPIKIVVPFAAGGAVDQIARILSNNMPKDVVSVVENRSGAGGDIGVVAVGRAESQGRTVLLHTSSFVINAILRGKADEVAKSLSPLA